MNRTSSDLTGKKVVITGGSSGIGLATAKALVDLGAEVVIASRSEVKLNNARRYLNRDKVTSYTLDVTQEQEVQEFFRNVGDFDHLVTSAAGALGGAFLELDTAAARSLIDSKFWGQYYTVKYGAPKLSPKGSITLFSGIVSRRPMAGYSTFAAIAGAMESLTRVLALELAPIRVNCVTPGVIDTPIWTIMPEDQRHATLKAVASQLPVKRVGTAEDVAQTVLYLIQNGFSTGAIVDVDGGHRVI